MAISSDSRPSESRKTKDEKRPLPPIYDNSLRAHGPSAVQQSQLTLAGEAGMRSYRQAIAVVVHKGGFHIVEENLYRYSAKMPEGMDHLGEKNRLLHRSRELDIAAPGIAQLHDKRISFDLTAVDLLISA
jgi:hypothetical protein